MPRIHQLPPDVISKIAAGEVIERPASVVKELLENSIDAGSTRIDIDLDAGGTELIRVVDDGCGIVPDDLALAFSQHATSKLVTADDLFSIGTMGFRGEALASIAGVGQVTLQSRPRDAASGSEIKCDGGALSPLKPWNGSVGTRIEVRHLFYNVPVRKRFLKSVATELGHVCETVTRLALAHPHLHLTLRHNGRLVYDIPGSAGLLDRIALFFTGEVRDALYEIDSGEGPMRVTGYIADPKCDRGNSKLQYLFVNGRWFRDRSLAHALQESFRGLLMTGRYAIGFLYLTIPPDKLDVNVHPTKAEVRFQENSVVYSLVRGTIKHRLLRENLIPQLTVPQGIEDGGASAEPKPDESAGLFASPRREIAERTLAPWELGEAADPLWRKPAPVRAAEAIEREEIPPQAVEPKSFAEFIRGAEPTPPSPPSLKGRGEEAYAAPLSDSARVAGPTPPAPLPEGRGETEPARAADVPQRSMSSSPLPEGRGAGGVGSTARADRDNGPPAPPLPSPAALSALPPHSAIQFHDSYLVLETAEGMLVIDQHALHERILFEQIRRRVRDGQLEVQRLLIPEPIDLPAEQAALVLEAADALRELGLDVSDFGGNTILLSSYPTLLGRKPPHKVLRGVIDHLLTQERPPTKEALLHLLMATMACKAAVKAGDKLSQEEITYLLHLRAMAEDSHHCPHGRPTSLLFSRAELDKQFRRT